MGRTTGSRPWLTPSALGGEQSMYKASYVAEIQREVTMYRERPTSRDENGRPQKQ